MIYVTGDTHGDFGRFSKKKLRIKGMELTADDYVIVCGDLGLCWAKDITARTLSKSHIQLFGFRGIMIILI